MKITHVEASPVLIPVKPARHMVTALGWHRESKYILVRVGTDAGIEGVGEATVMPLWSGETVWGCKAILDNLLSPAVIGADPTNITDVDQRMDRVTRHNWFAKSAIEMACWDIAGKAAGKPVYELLGGAVRSRTIRCRFSMGAYEPDRAKARALELVSEGFTTIKVKVGGIAEKDIERVRVVRNTIGPKIAMTIDANCGWDVDTAIRCVNAMQDCNLSLNEQPTPDGDYGAIARVKRETTVPVMADDMCFDLIHAKELVRNNACDLISVYPGKNGGIRKSKEIVEFAAKNGVKCSIGSNLEWDLGTAAMGHLVIACKNMCVEEFPGDMLGPEYHEVRIAKQPVEINGPLVTISDRPGLGIDIDWDLVKTHRLKT
jgi:muconate cycloisomerase